MADTRKKSQRSTSGPPKTEEVQERENSLTIEIKDDVEKLKNMKCVSKLLVTSFTVLTVVTALVAVSLIAVSTLSAIAAGTLDTQEDSGRVVALIVLAVTAALTIAVIVYAQVATCTNKIRPIFVAAVVLSILAVIQAIIAGASVRVTEKDQVHITQALAESFQFAKQHSPRHVKTWASTQHSLNCCGMYSPFDYRSPNNVYMPPDVPISCCPTYDPTRSDLVQEKQREVCKARNEYYEIGCSVEVLEVITETSLWAFTVAVVLIVLEFLSAVSGAYVVKKRKEVASQKAENPDKEDKPEISQSQK